MKLFPLIMLILLLAACNRFNRDQLLNSSFGADLESIANGKKTEYLDGLFLVFDVEDTDPLYSQFFSKPFHQADVSLSFGGTEFLGRDVGPIRYRLLDSFDGYTKTIFYIPKQKLLGFGYSDGLM